MIKAIFLDIDGTMVSFNTHRMPDNTRQALLSARRQGVKLFVATGRHTTDINNLGDLPFDGYITLNGAYCTVGGQVISKTHIPHDDVAAFVRYGEEIEPIPCFFVEADGVTANMEAPEMKRMMEIVHFTPRPVAPSRTFLGKEIFQMTAFFPSERENDIMRRLPGCIAARWYPSFTDITARSVDKSAGLAQVGAYLGIAIDEMMAFGDGGNDISMIRYAGIGIAMDNAEERVKQVADYIAPSVDDDGIGHALRHFGIIKNED